MLYNYPPESPVSVDLPSFCFPHGVQPNLLERTPSMTSLNDLLYSQNYLNSDASSFIFLLKVRCTLPFKSQASWMTLWRIPHSYLFMSVYASVPDPGHKSGYCTPAISCMSVSASVPDPGHESGYCTPAISCMSVSVSSSSTLSHIWSTTSCA